MEINKLGLQVLEKAKKTCEKIMIASSPLKRKL